MLSVLYFYFLFLTGALTNFPESSVRKESACSGGVSRDTGSTLGVEDPLEKSTETHCSIRAWRIPWTQKPGRLQSTGLQRVGHDWTQQQANTRAFSHIRSECITESYWLPCQIHPESDLTNAAIQAPAIIFSFCVAATASWAIPCCHLYSPLPQQPDWSVKAEARQCQVSAHYPALASHPIWVKQSPCSYM